MQIRPRDFDDFWCPLCGYEGDSSAHQCAAKWGRFARVDHRQIAIGFPKPAKRPKKKMLWRP